MNVLLVHNFYQQPGGEDQVFAEEANLLENRGHRVGRLTMDNDSIDGMGKLTVARKTIWNREAQEALRQSIREIDANVVHFHNTFPLVSPAAYYAAHEQGAAVVQTLHNYRLICPTATFYRDGKVCEECLGRAVPWPGVLHACYRGNRLATATIAAMLAFHRAKRTWRDEVDIYIALTEFARSKFVEAGLPAEKIIVKPNFVDPDPGIGPGDGDFALFIGRLTEEKGVRTLMEAWKSLYPRCGLQLKIAGDGPLRQVVEEFCKGAPGAGIDFLGRRPLPEVYSMMGSARALMFPSEWYEGLPRTIVESLAKGTPVIASRLGSMTELIDHNRTGYLFEPGDREDLARQVEALLNQTDSARTQMRQAARLEYESRYTANQNYAVLIDSYDKAMAARGMVLQHTPSGEH
jgi:glycosyltransferase involved in cell wall biosynthesis